MSAFRWLTPARSHGLQVAVAVCLSWPGLVHGQAAPPSSAAAHATTTGAAPDVTTGQAGSTAESGGDDRITPDRPGFGDPASVVGVGVVQLEIGTRVERHTGSGVASHLYSLPNALVRVGVTDRVEVRAGGPGFLAVTDPSAGRVAGVADLQLGLKIAVVRDTAAGLDLSLLPAVSVPVRGAVFSSNAYDPSLTVAWERALPAGLEVSGNLGVASSTGDRRRFTQTVFSLAIEHGVGRRGGAYGEVVRLGQPEPKATAAWFAQTGLTYALGSEVQADVEIGHGLSAGAPTWIFGVGLSLRRVPRVR